MIWLKLNGVMGSDVQSESRHKQQILDDCERVSDEYLQLCRNKVAIRIAAEIELFYTKSCDHAGKMERSLVWLAYVNAWVETVLRSLSEPETTGGQRQTRYVDTQRSTPEIPMESPLRNFIVFVHY